MDNKKFDTKTKSFWERPEGITGMIFLAAIAIGGGFALYNIIPLLLSLAQSVLGLTALLLTLGAVLYTVLDPKVRNLGWYFYKSIMRWVTSIFVNLDPIGILKSYVEELEENLRKMNRQISKLRGQMHKLREVIHNNEKDIQSNLNLASKAKANDERANMILKSRKAGRLKESNMRLEDLYKKMEVMYRVLTRMHENSHILKEDIKDQVAVKEQERKAIHASNSAMKSAMSIMSGDPDKRAMFDAAMEAIAEDVSKKVGEMERFMQMSSNFMESLDLQNGVYEEKGLKMLEEWEKEGNSLLLGIEKNTLLNQANSDADILDLDAPIKEPIRDANHRNQYDNFFE